MTKCLHLVIINNRDNNTWFIKVLIIVSSFYIMFSTLFIVNGVMRGAGDTLMPMFITLIALWLVRIPASYWLSRHLGEVGIWWAIPLGWFLGMILSWFYYLTGKTILFEKCKYFLCFLY